MQHSRIRVRGGCLAQSSASASSRSFLRVLAPTNGRPVASISALISSRRRSLTAVASARMRSIRTRKAYLPWPTSYGASISKGMTPMRSRTSEPGSMAQNWIRSKSGPSGGTATLNRVTLMEPLKRPMDISSSPPRGGGEGGILAHRGTGGRGRRRRRGRSRGRRRGPRRRDGAVAARCAVRRGAAFRSRSCRFSRSGLRVQILLLDRFVAGHGLHVEVGGRLGPGVRLLGELIESSSCRQVLQSALGRLLAPRLVLDRLREDEALGAFGHVRRLFLRLLGGAEVRDPARSGLFSFFLVSLGDLLRNLGLLLDEAPILHRLLVGGEDEADALVRGDVG